MMIPLENSYPQLQPLSAKMISSTDLDPMLGTQMKDSSSLFRASEDVLHLLEINSLTTSPILTWSGDPSPTTPGAESPPSVAQWPRGGSWAETRRVLEPFHGRLISE